MPKLEQGTLILENITLEHIQGLIDEEGYSPKDALKEELSFCGLNINDVRDIQLNGNQLKNINYINTYSKVVCDFWNNK